MFQDEQKKSEERSRHNSRIQHTRKRFRFDLRRQKLCLALKTRQVVRVLVDFFYVLGARSQNASPLSFSLSLLLSRSVALYVGTNASYTSANCASARATTTAAYFRSGCGSALASSTYFRIAQGGTSLTLGTTTDCDAGTTSA